MLGRNYNLGSVNNMVCALVEKPSFLFFFVKSIVEYWAPPRGKNYRLVVRLKSPLMLGFIIKD